MKNPTTGTSNRDSRRKTQQQQQQKPAKVNPPAVEVQAKEWGSTREPWPTIIDESDFTREVIRVWRENVFAAENEGEQQKMEDLYNRLDEERKRLNDPDTWGWGGEPDELNDWAGDWPDGAVYEPHRWGEQRQPHSDKTPEGLSSPRNLDPSFLKLVADCAEKLHGDGRQRCYAFAQLPPEGMVEKIREIAYQLRRFKKP